MKAMLAAERPGRLPVKPRAARPTHARRARRGCSKAHAWRGNIPAIVLLSGMSLGSPATGATFRAQGYGDLKEKADQCIRERSDGSCPTLAESVGAMGTWDVHLVTKMNDGGGPYDSGCR